MRQLNWSECVLTGGDGKTVIFDSKQNLESYTAATMPLADLLNSLSNRAAEFVGMPTSIDRLKEVAERIVAECVAARLMQPPGQAGASTAMELNTKINASLMKFSQNEMDKFKAELLKGLERSTDDQMDALRNMMLPPMIVRTPKTGDITELGVIRPEDYLKGSPWK
jgi:hypothetical protein